MSNPIHARGAKNKWNQRYERVNGQKRYQFKHLRSLTIKNVNHKTSTIESINLSGRGKSLTY